MANQGSRNSRDKEYQTCKGGLIIARINQSRSFKYLQEKYKKKPYDKCEEIKIAIAQKICYQSLLNRTPEDMADD